MSNPNINTSIDVYAKTTDSKSYTFKAVLASTVGYALDGFDMLLLGFILSAVSVSLGITQNQAGAIVTWTLIGAVIGGLLFGYLSDIYGRVRVLSWSIILFAVFTGLCAFSHGYWDLLIYRTLSGLGLGGEFGIGMALAAEACKSHQRTRVASYVGLGWQAGTLAAAIIVPLLLPFIGWRGAFLIGVIPALVSMLIRHNIEEPEVFTSKANTKTKSNPFLALIKDGKTLRTSIGITILTSVQNFGYFGMMIWMPTYLSHQFNYSLTKSGFWTASTIIGMAFGIWLFGQLADRFGRKPIFILYQIGAVVMVILYSQLTSQYGLLVGGAVMGIFVNGMLGGYGSLISESYPTSARATAQNTLFNIGRGIGGFGPLAVGYVAYHYSFEVAILGLASLYVIDILATLFLITSPKSTNLS